MDTRRQNILKLSSQNGQDPVCCVHRLPLSSNAASEECFNGAELVGDARSSES